MPPQTASPSLHLLIQSSTFYLTQLKASSPLPLPLVSQISTPSSSTTFLSITRTDEEISIVSDVDLGLEGDVVERPTKWCCLKVAGPMDLGLTGIMNDLTTPLKAAGIPIFAISTWNTDFLLVPEEKGVEAAEVMRKDGWTVRNV